MFSNISKVFRKARVLSSIGAFLLAALPPNQAAAQSDHGGFNPNLDGVAYVVLIQDDGRILIGGAFSSVRPEAGAAIGRHNLARYLPDGTLDSGFDPNFDGTVTALALQPDGRIVVGGRFTTVDPNRTGNHVVRNGIARLNVDGTLDTGFDPNLGGMQTPQVHALVVQSDGKIVLGGDFNQLQPAGTSNPVARNHLARVNAGGSVDSGFAPNPNNIVYSLGLQADGRLIVGGGFTQMQPDGGSNVTDTSRIARLNVDGSLDASFNIVADNRVMCMVFQADGSLVIGGDFRSIRQGVSGSVYDRISIARIRADDQVDLDFRPNANANVGALAIQKDGRILVGGAFTSFLPSGSFTSLARRYLGRLNPEGTLDTSFSPTPNYTVYTIAVQSDGSIVTGGAFTRFRPASSPGSTIRNRAARLYSDGTLDSAFESDPGGEVTTLVREADGKVIVAGLFSSMGGVTRQNLARIDSNGIVDETFTASTNGRILSAVRQSDGRIVIVGEFSRVNETVAGGIARINTDGSLDSGFRPNPNAPVAAVVLLPDGKLMIGGDFTNLSPNDGETFFQRSYLARLNADGTVDDGYTAGTSAGVNALSLQADGKLLVGGLFTFVIPSGGGATATRNFIARLNEDGSLDVDFDPNANSSIEIIALQSDGKILLGGRFTSFQPNGGEVTTTRNFLARLNSDGKVDPGFDPNPDSRVRAIHIMSDGRILVGGDFLYFQSNGAETIVYRERIARLNSDGGVDSTLNLGANDAALGFLPEGDGGVLIAGGFSGMTSFTGDEGTVVGKVVRLTGEDVLDSDYIVRSSNPSGSRISSLAVQGDGSILIGGSFESLGGSENRNIARMFSDGNVDRSFASQTNGAVHAILIRPDTTFDVERGRLVAWLDPDGSYHDAPNATDGSELLGAVSAIVEQSDGRLLVAGSFTDGNLQIGPYLARFNTDGSLDSTFKPILNASVSAVALQADGRILIGGLFTTINGFARNRMARLSSDGSLDTAFDPNVSSQVRTIAVQGDGKILIGGNFSSLSPNGATSPTARSRVARLNTDGTVDAGFDPSPNDQVYAILWQADGKILIGGVFNLLSPNGGAAVSRFRLARVLSTGALDEEFSAQAGGPVFAIKEQVDGKYVIGGSFFSVAATGSGSDDLIARHNIARFNADGSVDDFDPSANSAVNSIDIESDGRILIGGSFTGLAPNGQSFRTPRNRLARVNADGSLDTGFNPNADNSVFAVLGRADGTIVVGGSFHFLNPQSDIFFGGNFSDVSGAQVRNLARVNADGTPDSSFDPRPDRPVDGLALQPDGRVLVTGGFSLIAGEVRNRIARFERSGALDEGFDPDANGPVRAVAVQPDGKIVIGGEFTQLGGLTQRRMARLNSDGTLDSSYGTEADGSVVALALQPDGMVVVAGAFSEIGGTSRPYLARIRPDGTVDGSFSPIPNGEVHAVALQADGRILVGGSFTEIGGQSRAGIARLNADGSLDASFQADTDGDVFSVILLENGQPFIAGNFTQVGNDPRYLTARLGTNVAAIDNMSVSSSRTRITWIREGASPELTSVIFASSGDGRNWTALGTGERIPQGSGWEIDVDTAFPADEYYFIRAQGVVPTSTGSSSGFIRSVAQFYGSVASGPAGTGPAGGGSLDATDEDTSSDHADSSGDSGSDYSGGSTGNGAGGASLDVASIDWDVSTLGADAAFLNLSSRVFLGAGDVFIAGFSVTGSEARRLLVRAIGPGLAVFGIDDHAGLPRLQILDSEGGLVAENSGWGGDRALTEVFVEVGAFPLSPDSMDSAIQVDLEPGVYTIRLSDTDGVPGVILAEIYDASDDSTQSGNRLVNLSSRGPVSSGSGVATGGFIVGGENNALILVRAIGPGLTEFGVSDAIDDPVLHVYDASGRLLAANDDWAVPLGVDPVHPAFAQADLVGAQDLAGAFRIDPTGRDSVVLMVVEPGAYTAQARSENGAEGETIIEVYLVNLAP
ncbi:MAG: hypothetical protein DRP71_04655 [Verrucomicrobia bacterium]|nr:MAG: hypothetical protein DRP71_04655 [Verrucomicrobiota bacterium]